MALKNILLIGPEEIVGEIASVGELPCKVFTIHDGFKALVGLVKLLRSTRALDGIYIHGETSRTELPDYIDVVRAIEIGLGKPPLPIWLAINDNAPGWSQMPNLVVKKTPRGDSTQERLTALIAQLTKFSGGIKNEV